MVHYILFRTQFFTQEYEGRDTDISLVPWQGHRSLTSAMLNLIHNPTHDEFMDWVKAAERETWRCVLLPDCWTDFQVHAYVAKSFDHGA
jgi:hypothetical protein